MFRAALSKSFTTSAAGGFVVESKYIHLASEAEQSLRPYSKAVAFSPEFFYFTQRLHIQSSQPLELITHEWLLWVPRPIFRGLRMFDRSTSITNAQFMLILPIPVRP